MLIHSLTHSADKCEKCIKLRFVESFTRRKHSTNFIKNLNSSEIVHLERIESFLAHRIVSPKIHDSFCAMSSMSIPWKWTEPNRAESSRTEPNRTEPFVYKVDSSTKLRRAEMKCVLTNRDCTTKPKPTEKSS